MFSQTAEYALRAIVVLGSHRARPLTGREIATRTRVPAGYLSKVMRGLVRAGLVHAQRGPHGGFSLTRSLDRLNLLEVIEAVDPFKRIERCPLGLTAHRKGLCSLHRRLDEGMALAEDLYRGTTIRGLLDEDSTPLALRPEGTPASK
jgi:Rrf2 family protein